MPFKSRRAPLVLNEETRRQLDLIGRSRTEPRHRVDRARILLKYAAGESVSAVARALGTNRPRIERCLDKALQIGPLAALSDLPGRGHPTSITDDAKAWVTSLACQKPKELGYWGIGITQVTTRCCISAPKRLLREGAQACTQHSGRDPLCHPASLMARRDVVVRGACVALCEDLESTMDPISARPAGCVAGRRLKMGSNCRDTTESLANGAPARPPGSPTTYSGHWSYPDTPAWVFVRTVDNRPAGATYPPVLQKERTSIAEETGPRHRVEDLDPGRDSPAQDSVLPGTAR